MNPKKPGPQTPTPARENKINCISAPSEARSVKT